MLSLPPSVRIFLCTLPTDMRRSFDRLAAMTREVIGKNPLSGHLFVFCNRKRDRVKILFWDRDGYVLWYKRLEDGAYRFPIDERNKVEVSVSELSLLLEGIEWSRVKRQKRFPKNPFPTNEENS